MKRWKKIALTSICLVGLIGSVALSADKPTRFPGGIEVTAPRSGVSEYLIQGFRDSADSSTTVFTVDIHGRINKGDVVLIDEVDDLSTFEDAASGQSYFTIEWGKTYLVDPYDIAQCAACASTGTTGMVAFSSVTGVLEWVDATNINMEATVIMAQTGTTGYGQWASGATTVTIWAPRNSGITAYALDPGLYAQGISGASYQIVRGGTIGTFHITATALASGQSVYGALSRMGQSVTFRSTNDLNSSVSAYIIHPRPID